MKSPSSIFLLLILSFGIQAGCIDCGYKECSCFDLSPEQINFLNILNRANDEDLKLILENADEDDISQILSLLTKNQRWELKTRVQYIEQSSGINHLSNGIRRLCIQIKVHQ